MVLLPIEGGRGGGGEGLIKVVLSSVMLNLQFLLPPIRHQQRVAHLGTSVKGSRYLCLSTGAKFGEVLMRKGFMFQDE